MYDIGICQICNHSFLTKAKNRKYCNEHSHRIKYTGKNIDEILKNKYIQNEMKKLMQGDRNDKKKCRRK